MKLLAFKTNWILTRYTKRISGEKKLCTHPSIKRSTQTNRQTNTYKFDWQIGKAFVKMAHPVFCRCPTELRLKIVEWIITLVVVWWYTTILRVIAGSPILHCSGPAHNESEDLICSKNTKCSIRRLIIWIWCQAGLFFFYKKNIQFQAGPRNGPRNSPKKWSKNRSLKQSQKWS